MFLWSVGETKTKRNSFSSPSERRIERAREWEMREKETRTRDERAELERHEIASPIDVEREAEIFFLTESERGIRS